MNVFKRKSFLYVIILSAWLMLVGFLVYVFYYNLNLLITKYSLISDITNEIRVKQIFIYILLTLDFIFLIYFFLNGVKDLIYPISFYIFKKPIFKDLGSVIKTNISNINDKVLLIYCTCNDFDEYSLYKSMQQDYKNYETYILDDSTNEDYIKKINEFANKNNVKVIRRENRKGFKAGNINNFLKSELTQKTNYKYFVVLDSDEVIPSNFIRESLKYFTYYSNIGIVQGNHIATRNRNFFMKLFAIGINSHWTIYQSVKNRFGFMSMLGHGAMISKNCYDSVGGFPELVAEDLCISIQARVKGFLTVFAPNILCEEEYPINYLAFKKRHNKSTQVNFEFIKNYSKVIKKSKLKWYEKLDIVMFTYNLPLTSVFIIFLIINIILFPILNIRLEAPKTINIIFIILTCMFFFAPMLNDFLVWVFKINPLRMLFYFISVIVLYGSMFALSLYASIFSLFGKKAKFIVTPKTSSKINIFKSIKYQWLELVFCIFLMALSYLISRSILPVIIISFSGLLSPFLNLYQNIEYDETKTNSIDDYIKKPILKIINNITQKY